jgi:hypothetical protein
VSKRYIDPSIARSRIDGVSYLPRPPLAGGNGDGREWQRVTTLYTVSVSFAVAGSEW